MTFLGADTPLDTLLATIRTIKPSLTVLVATEPAMLAVHDDGLRQLCALTPTAIAGIADAQPLPMSVPGHFPPTSLKQPHPSRRDA